MATTTLSPAKAVVAIKSRNLSTAGTIVCVTSTCESPGLTNCENIS